YSQTVYEGLYGQNNRGSGIIPVTYREPDLRVTDLVVPSTPPHSGQTFPVTWTVTNIGTRDTRESFWIDRLYLSRDPTLDAGDIQLAEDRHVGALAIDKSYTRTLDVTLPEAIQGNFYLLVFVDSDVAEDRTGIARSTILPTLPGV